jgi:hypothetical protein
MKFSPALILSCALGIACSSSTSDEQRVRDIFSDVERAAEARDVGDVLEFVGADYADAQGNSRDSLALFLRGYFATHPRLELVTSVDDLQFPVPDLARARVTVRGLELDRLDFGSSAALDVELRREDGEWRVVRADRAREP